MDEIVGGIFATVIMGMLLITAVVVWAWVMSKIARSIKWTPKEPQIVACQHNWRGVDEDVEEW